MRKMAGSGLATPATAESTTTPTGMPAGSCAGGAGSWRAVLVAVRGRFLAAVLVVMLAVWGVAEAEAAEFGFHGAV